MPAAGRRHGFLLSGIPPRRVRNGLRARRHFRLGRAERRCYHCNFKSPGSQRMSAAIARPAFWVPGDWNGFFGLFTNVLLNVIVLTGLCLGVVHIPGDVVFGRILPALGIALPLGNLFYAFMAYQLAKKSGRTDAT